MLETFTLCLVVLIASNCSVVHPPLDKLIPDMNQTYAVKQVELKITDCQQMYSNITLMNICYEKWGPEIDP